MSAEQRCPCCESLLSSFIPLDLLIFSNLLSFQEMGGVVQCRCGLVQKAQGCTYMRALEKAYASYDLLFSANKIQPEIPVLKFGSKHQSIANLVKNVIEENGFKTWLDYGCGEASLLRQTRSILPDLNLLFFGYDPYVQVLNLATQNIQCSNSLKDFDSISGGEYDLISMIHTLEHISNPLSTLLEIRSRLSRRGKVLIELPDLSQNPYDLVVADHLFHFDYESINKLLLRCGFHIDSISDQISAKEITILASIK